MKKICTNRILTIMATTCFTLLALFFACNTAKAESEYVKITRLEQTSKTQVTITFEVTEPSENLKIKYYDTQNRTVAVTAVPAVVGEKTRTFGSNQINYDTNSYTQVLDIDISNKKDKFDIIFVVENQFRNEVPCGSSVRVSETDKETLTFDPYLAPVVDTDTQAPVPGAMQQLGIFSDSLTANWTAASDDITKKENLRYSVYYSKQNNILTVANMLSNGTLAKDGLTFTGGGTLSVTGLSPDTNYYVNVMVQDEAGNKAAYGGTYAKTLPLPDTQAPVPGSSGTICISGTYQTNVNILWTTGTDNVTLPENLQYRVYYSTANNIRTVAEMEANGTPVGNYAKNMTRQNINGLTSNIRYYFNLIIMDEAGNKAAYTSVSTTTKNESTEDGPPVRFAPPVATSTPEPTVVPNNPNGN